MREFKQPRKEQSRPEQPRPEQPLKERSLSPSFSQPATSQLVSQPTATESSQPEVRKPESSSSGELEKLRRSQLDQSPSPDQSAPLLAVPSSSPPKAVLLEKPKAILASFGEPVVKQRPPMDTAELAQGQQPDRGTIRKRKGDRPAPPTRS